MKRFILKKVFKHDKTSDELSKIIFHNAEITNYVDFKIRNLDEICEFGGLHGKVDLVDLEKMKMSLLSLSETSIQWRTIRRYTYDGTQLHLQPS